LVTLLWLAIERRRTRRKTESALNVKLPPKPKINSFSHACTMLDGHGVRTGNGHAMQPAVVPAPPICCPLKPPAAPYSGADAGKYSPGVILWSNQNRMKMLLKRMQDDMTLEDLLAIDRKKTRERTRNSAAYPRSFAVDYRKPLLADTRETCHCWSSVVFSLSFWQAWCWGWLRCIVS
jgi:hypothetical protein